MERYFFNVGGGSPIAREARRSMGACAREQYDYLEREIRKRSPVARNALLLKTRMNIWRLNHVIAPQL